KSTVVIPAFNNVALTKQCLAAVLRIGGCEVIVVNDASTDGTLKMLAAFGDKIKVITHKTNQGFAKTCNDGAKAARTEFVVFLNNDTIPQPGWLRALEHYAQKNSKAAVVGAKLLYPDNTVQHAGVIVCQDKYPRHIYTGFPANHPAVSQSRRFQIVTAAAMLVRKKVFTAARGFDTKFQNGFEDVDFCLRLGERGHEIHYCAESVAKHFESVAPGRFKHDKKNVALYRRRWFAKVQPDDLKFFLADGLLELHYEGQFPLHLKVSPELAVIDAGRKNALEKNLAAKNRQLAGLTRDMTKLVAELGGAATASPTLENNLVRTRLRQLVQQTVPRSAKILVVSKGDGALLELGGRKAQHFPQSRTGGYAGFHPANGKAAVAALEKLSPQFDHLVIPQTSLWWLEHYREFAIFLKVHSRLVTSETNTGNIYKLHG
ncbi:MAG: N-acetylglucosaminyl-diphospho-decaprenol L-rhamnosyltransferase, partial [Verrucomicrobiota bacterium]